MNEVEWSENYNLFQHIIVKFNLLQQFKYMGLQLWVKKVGLILGIFWAVKYE
jgi:hypothetical protein